MKLREIPFEGLIVVVDEEAEVKPGDTYVAKRLDRWWMQTCKEVNFYGHVVPDKYSEGDLPFFHKSECFKIVEMR